MDIKKIIEIMEYIYLNDKKLKEDDIKNKFGEENFNDFKRYCFRRGIYEFVQKYSLPGFEHDQKYDLTDYGISELNRLKQEQILLDIQKSQTGFNRVLAAATIIIALGVAYPIIEKIFALQTYLPAKAILLVLWIVIIGVIFYLIGHSVSWYFWTLFKKK